MGYAEPCFDQFVCKVYVPVFERWLYFKALRIPNRVSSDNSPQRTQRSQSLCALCVFVVKP
jgi:hypothetical protein